MRIADTMTFDQVRGNISRNRSQMADLQNQAASQKRVTKPSDDPMAASRVLHSRIDFQGNKQFVKNLNYAKSFLETTDQALGEVTENLLRVKELAISQSNDASASETTRRAVATEISQILDHVVSIGNRKLGDRFIFGGFKTQNKPFNLQGEYAGDAGEMMIHIDKSSFLPMNLTGDRVFLGDGLSADGIVHASQDPPLTIEDFRAQQNSKEGETPGESGRPSQPGDQKPAEVMMRNLAHVDIRRDPTSESEGERVEQEDGARKPGGINVFSVLRDLEISLRTNDKQGVQDSLDVLDQAVNQVVLARAQVGSRDNVVTSLLQSLEIAKVDNQSTISQYEDADIFSTVSDINKTESTLQATLQTSGRLVEPSLLSFLR